MYLKETKQAAQTAYKEARAFGHTKEEARNIRDNYKSSKQIVIESSNNDDVDNFYWVDSTPYFQDSIDD